MNASGLAGFIRLFVFVSMALLSVTTMSSPEETAPPKHHTADGFRNYPLVKDPPNLGFKFYWKRFISSFTSPNVPQGHVLAEKKAISLYEALSSHNTVTWIGQSTLLIKINGITILTDPFFAQYSSPLSMGPRRFTDPGIAVDNLPAIDIIMISHNHYDHLDEAFIEALPNKSSVHVLVPLKLGAFFSERGYEHIHELDWYESASLHDFRFTALPSVHYSSRGMGDKNKTLWCSWAVSTPMGQYAFIGDSAYSPVLFKEIGERFGPFDLSMLAIGTYGNRKYGVNNHATPEEAVLMGRELNAAALLGIHWGTIDLSDEDPWEPPERFRSAGREAGYAPESLWLMKVGETRILPKRE